MAGTNEDGMERKVAQFAVVAGIGVCLFLGGFFFGEIIQYKKIQNDINWFEDHCVCSEFQERIFAPNWTMPELPSSQPNQEQQQNNNSKGTDENI